MSISTDLLKADRIGIRDFKEHVSKKVLGDIIVITEHGMPISVNLPYQDILELMDMLDELSDPGAITAVFSARKSIKEGRKGISVNNLFDKMRAKNK